MSFNHPGHIQTLLSLVQDLDKYERHHNLVTTYFKYIILD